MFERSNTGERVVLVHLNFHETSKQEMEEFCELADAAGVKAVATVVGSGDVLNPRYFVGSGKAEEIRRVVADSGADVVLFNHTLTPAQERNLERFLQCRVLDRTGVILDIFSQRARSFEGKLQVELAQLQYLSTRLVRGWTHLERQRGGIGLRGPGETQLETDRRLIGKRIKQINQKLEKVCKQRGQKRRSRRRATLISVSLVGYTNAGKSTVFNRLTGSSVYAADKLFATLDPTLRRIEILSGGPIILGDTVGFIRHLPHELVAAFRATLEEIREADLLLHVIDASSEDRSEKAEQVTRVISEIGAAEVPQIEVYNKIDLIPYTEPRIQRDDQGRIRQVWLSSRTGHGLELLTKAIAEHFSQNRVHSWLRLPVTAGRLRSRLYALGAVLDETVDNNGSWTLEVEISRPCLEQLCESEGLDCQLVAATLRQHDQPRKI